MLATVMLIMYYLQGWKHQRHLLPPIFAYWGHFRLGSEIQRKIPRKGKRRYRVSYHVIIILFVSLDLCSQVLVIQVIGNVVTPCCGLLWSIMTSHSLRTNLAWPTSSYQWRSQQFNQRSISALWNDNDCCNICELAVIMPELLSLVNTFYPNRVWCMIG